MVNCLCKRVKSGAGAENVCFTTVHYSEFLIHVDAPSVIYYIGKKTLLILWIYIFYVLSVVLLYSTGLRTAWSYIGGLVFVEHYNGVGNSLKTLSAFQDFLNVFHLKWQKKMKHYTYMKYIVKGRDLSVMVSF